MNDKTIVIMNNSKMPALCNAISEFIKENVKEEDIKDLDWMLFSVDVSRVSDSSMQFGWPILTIKKYGEE